MQIHTDGKQPLFEFTYNYEGKPQQFILQSNNIQEAVSRIRSLSAARFVGEYKQRKYPLLTRLLLAVRIIFN